MNWPVVSLELGVGASVVGLLLADLVLHADQKRHLWKLALGGLLVLAGILGWQQQWVSQHFDPMFVFDGFAGYFKWLFLFFKIFGYFFF